MWAKKLLAVAVSVLSVSQASQAATLSTTFATTNVAAANYTSFFDLTVTAGGGITLTDVTVNVANGTGGTSEVDVYTRPTTYVGAETNSAAWTLRSTGTLSGSNGPVTSNIADFKLLPGTYGIAIVNKDYQIAWNSPAADYSNADALIHSGAVSSAIFGASVTGNATWDGTLTYTVPEPASLGLVALATLSLRRTRRGNRPARRI